MVSESTLCKCPYEVGDVLTTRNAADPATRWPGTSWQKITDRFILGAGGSYSVGATGGEAEHTLTVNEMPSHYHRMNRYLADSSFAFADGSDGGQGHSFTYSYGASPVREDIDPHTASSGEGTPHNNMPPYIALYFWERIA